MIIVTHMMGLTAWEGGVLSSPTRTRKEKATAFAEIRSRYDSITASGWLIARGFQEGRKQGRNLMKDTGRSFIYDDLAGDEQYIFLEAPSRYFPSERLPPEALYGWQFDAEQLIAQGALVCPGDLGGDYEDVIYQACTEVAVKLPRLAPVSEDDLAEFMAWSRETDPELIAYVRQASTDPTDALYNAITGMPRDPVPNDAIERARGLIRERIDALQRQYRVGGREGLDLLATGQYCEMVVRERVPLSLAVAVIECGVIR